MVHIHTEGGREKALNSLSLFLLSLMTVTVKPSKRERLELSNKHVR